MCLLHAKPSAVCFIHFTFFDYPCFTDVKKEVPRSEIHTQTAIGDHEPPPSTLPGRLLSDAVGDLLHSHGLLSAAQRSEQCMAPETGCGLQRSE